MVLMAAVMTGQKLKLQRGIVAKPIDLTRLELILEWAVVKPNRSCRGAVGGMNFTGPGLLLTLPK